MCSTNWIQLVAVVLFSAVAFAADPPKSALVKEAQREYDTRAKWAQEQYDGAVKKAQAVFDAEMKKAEVDYEAKLKQALEVALKAKDLDEANRIDTMIRAVAANRIKTNEVKEPRINKAAAERAKLESELIGTIWEWTPAKAMQFKFNGDGTAVAYNERNEIITIMWMAIDANRVIGFANDRFVHVYVFDRERSRFDTFIGANLNVKPKDTLKRVSK